MFQQLKKILHNVSDIVLLNNVSFRENNNFRIHKDSINKKIVSLLIKNTAVYLMIVMSYFFIENKEDIYFIFLNSAVVLYGVYYVMFFVSLASQRNMDCLRTPCNRAECSIGTANYFKKVMNLSIVSKWINISSVILLFIVVIL